MVCAIIKLGLVKIKIDLPRVQVAGPRQRRQKRGLLMVQNCAQGHASVGVTWYLFHQGGSSLDLSIQGSEVNF
jgi:hypothetical protein